jgi:hypothetical protein
LKLEISRCDGAEIRPDDSWRVTHRIGGRWVVFSESYQLRQRQFLATANRFASPHVYHLLIDERGSSIAGWLLLKSPLAVISDTGRYENLDLDLRVLLAGRANLSSKSTLMGVAITCKSVLAMRGASPTSTTWPSITP